MAPKMNRGGLRKGAGRPQLDERGAVVPTKLGLRMDQILWLKQQAKAKDSNVSAVLRAWVDLRMARSKS